MSAPPTRTAVLHIGPMKTGSTAIQSWLRANAAALRAGGVAVPLAGTAANLSKLAPIFQGRRRGENETGVTAAALTAELERLPAEVGTAVFSGELLAHELHGGGIARLRAALEPFFGDWLVVLYLRRQDEIETSRLTTIRRRGATRELFTHPIDYQAVIEDWAGVFGRGALRPRLYARECLVEGDVVADFAVTAGLPRETAPAPAGRQNASLRPEAQALLKALGERIGGTALRERGGYPTLMRTLARDFAGPGLLPARAQAEAFVASVAAANERVRAAWFPERAALFDDDFSRYPEAPTPEPSAERQLEVALAALADLLGAPDAEGAKRRRRQERKAAKGSGGPRGRG